MDDPQAILQLKRGVGPAIGPQRLALLAAIRDHGSIAAAAGAVGLSYKGAWDGVQALNNLFERPLVEAQPGGASGGGARVTEAGTTVLDAYANIAADLGDLLARLGKAVSGGAPGPNLLWRLSMKTSARNAFRGKVAHVTDGAVNAEVTLNLGGGLSLVAVITRDSLADLGLAPGVEAIALIKSSFVILVPGDAPLRTSARNRLPGTVVRHEAGAVNDEVVLDLGQGKTLTAIVTRASGEGLGLKVGDRAQALIKASHIILAVD